MDREITQHAAPLRQLHAAVYGRVQGVGYRLFVQREAQALGLVGWARNLTDGSVEVVAEGTGESLRRLQELLGEGPAGAAVDEVTVEWSDEAEGLQGFAIS
jgi:acylphosphatase